MSSNDNIAARPSVQVTLGGKVYDIHPLPMGPSRDWRKAFGEPFARLAQMMQGADSLELNDLSGIGQLVDVVKTVLMGSVEMCEDALFAYSPALREDQERILNEAYDEEALAAFVEVLKLAYPFGGILKLVQGIPSGPATRKKPR